MKRKILFISLLLFLFPIFVEAESCTVVSGTGKNIGDEIKCGSEHFYILEKVNNSVKMLSKYNLYVGDIIEKDTEVFNAETHGDMDSAYYAAEDHCNELRAIYGDNNVETTGKYTEDFNYSEYFCRIYKPLEYSTVKQSELAKGLYPNANKEILYPIYGSVNLDEEIGEKEFDENLDMIPETSQFNEYLNEYTKTLNNIGVNVLNIGYIKKSGIENLINAVSDKKIEIPTYSPDEEDIDPEDNLWNPNFEESWYFDYEKQVFKFSIQEYVPEKYKWLYGTTYWVGSATRSQFDYFDEFLSTVGDYCSSMRGCNISRLGVGLRPVVTIDSSEIDIPINYDYKFIKGDNQKLTINDIKEYTFTIDGDYSLFESLRIGNLDLVKDEDYIVTEGSTIITFTEKGIAKLNTLTKGEHEILVKYSNDKEVKGKLIMNQVAAKEIETVDNPRTSDNFNLYIVIFLVSISCLIIGLYNHNKKFLKKQ